MRFQIKRCSKCFMYTLEEECLHCNEPTKSVHPAKFSPDDRYMKYRLKEKYLKE